MFNKTNQQTGGIGRGKNLKGAGVYGVVWNWAECFECQCNSCASPLFGTFHYINAEICTGVNASWRFHYTHDLNKTARTRNKSHVLFWLLIVSRIWGVNVQASYMEKSKRVLSK
ncbi:unnamed protein product [Brassica oleracea var. botrytis]|uniref:(rape) hypothetical protein n=1 Tax=Brassica napus TaxID=3708 RepID=A0A816LPV0_BRANA|nr:unnamed protein product [Brassica napus]